jgi:hypothetical protein
MSKTNGSPSSPKAAALALWLKLFYSAKAGFLSAKAAKAEIILAMRSYKDKNKGTHGYAMEAGCLLKLSVLAAKAG